MVSFAPAGVAPDAYATSPESPTLYIVRVDDVDIVYLNLVLVSEGGIVTNVDEGLAPSALDSCANRTEDRGKFKAKRTARWVPVQYPRRIHTGHTETK